MHFLSRLRRPAVLTAALITSCALPAAAQAVDLRADSNRDGVVDVSGTSDVDAAAQGRTAIFLANVDDDQRRCKNVDRRGKPLSDQALATCNDAADDKVNGAHDLLDLARVRLLPAKDAAGPGRLSIDATARPFVRVFVRRSGRFVAFDGALTAAELRTGTEFAIEGKDVLRDRRVWDGQTQLRVTDAAGVSDDVALRLAPLLIAPDTLPVNRILAERAGFDEDSRAFHRDLDRGRRRAGLRRPVVTSGIDDLYIQDAFKPTTASMPAPGGKQQSMRVILRSANVMDARKSILREGGRYAFTRLRGRDVGAVQQVDLRWARTHRREWTYGSTGNVVAIPPYPGFPAGRIVLGARPGAQPDPSFLRLLDAQQAQRPLRVDTSWLDVGHIDEVVSFVPASTPRGWAMVVADPRMGVKLLRDASADGNGAARLRTGKTVEAPRAVRTSGGGILVTQVPAAISVDAVLRDRRVMRASLRAAGRIDRIVASIRAETGLTADEIVHVPSLFDRGVSYDETTSLRPQVRSTLTHYLPAIVNGQSLGRGIFAAPDPHGPLVDGRDLFKRRAERSLRAVGVRVSWVEDWLAHTGEGDVHCVTNVLRAAGPAWWRETDLR